MKRIMVGLDFSSMDAKLITYTGFISYFLKPEKIYFFNVQPNMDIPEKLFVDPQLNTLTIDEKLVDQMKQEVNRFFPDHQDYDVDYVIQEGSEQKEILRWTHIKQVDLLIVGLKGSEKGSGLIPRQLARKVFCSIMFVPERSRPRLNRVLVPTDFSAYSMKALEMGLDLIQGNEDAMVYLQHIYHVPIGYTKTGKTEKEFATIMERHAEEECEAFLKGIPSQKAIKKIFTYDARTRSPAYLIHDQANHMEADAIVIGARGRNALTALFLGSVTEKLLGIDTDIPIFVAKDPKHNFSFAEAIDTLAMT